MQVSKTNRTSNLNIWTKEGVYKTDFTSIGTERETANQKISLKHKTQVFLYIKSSGVFVRYLNYFQRVNEKFQLVNATKLNGIVKNYILETSLSYTRLSNIT